MAEIQALQALHYDLAKVGDLADVVAPPYDVIDSEQRAQLESRSAYNVVSIDLPRANGKDPYDAARELLASWEREGAVVRDEDPALWAHEQDYTGPDGVARTRRGFFCRVRIEDYGPGRVRPHERTHPGPKEDRLRLTRATRANLSPIFSLYSDPTRAGWEALAPFTAEPPWGTARDAEGTEHRVWRVADPQAIEAVRAAVADSELLIADGHHRYETAQAYAGEMDGAGPGVSGAPHDYVLMCLVALEDPGLTVFPTHRLVGNLDEGRREALAGTIERDFEAREVSLQELAELSAASSSGRFEVGFLRGSEHAPLWLTLKDQGLADSALARRSEAYRHLDTGVLEAVLLKGVLGLSDDDISHLNGFGYARRPDDAQRQIDEGAYDVAFIMRPTPVEQVKEVAAAAENMPPKSTYFYPKLLTGLLFNPLY
jgi:uncharacterized protein (DUF1015 family)